MRPAPAGRAARPAGRDSPPPATPQTRSRPACVRGRCRAGPAPRTRPRPGGSTPRWPSEARPGLATCLCPQALQLLGNGEDAELGDVVPETDRRLGEVRLGQRV